MIYGHSLSRGVLGRPSAPPHQTHVKRPQIRISVVVPTYRRAGSLLACLNALAHQSFLADEIVVVARRRDHETAEAVSRAHDLPLSNVLVDELGQVEAMMAGAGKADGAIIAFTDDDAVPREDWLERLVAHFADPRVGAVGGRDLVRSDELPLADEVGLVSSWGKVGGFHHRGYGAAREVAVLKGVNMAFRREALALPSGLKGVGAQVHNEVASSLWAAGRGWRIVYDPAIVVDHVPGPRFDRNQRSAPADDAVADAAYNLVFALLSNRPELFWRRAFYGLLVGDASAPGLVRSGYAAFAGERGLAARVVPSLRGQIEALRDIWAGRRLEMISPGDGGNPAPPRAGTTPL